MSNAAVLYSVYFGETVQWTVSTGSIVLTGVIFLKLEQDVTRVKVIFCHFVEKKNPVRLTIFCKRIKQRFLDYFERILVAINVKDPPQ